MTLINKSFLLMPIDQWVLHHLCIVLCRWQLGISFHLKRGWEEGGGGVRCSNRHLYFFNSSIITNKGGRIWTMNISTKNTMRCLLSKTRVGINIIDNIFCQYLIFEENSVFYFGPRKPIKSCFIKALHLEAQNFSARSSSMLNEHQIQSKNFVNWQ